MRDLTMAELDLVCGSGDGDFSETYWDPTAGQNAGGLVTETYGSDGHFIGLSVNYNVGQDQFAQNGTAYASLGGGVSGGVAGVTVSATPFQIYGYGGVGTPGLSAAAGYSNTSDLSGWSVNAATPGGVANSLAWNGHDGSVGVATPGWSATYTSTFSGAMYGIAGAIDRVVQQ